MGYTTLMLTRANWKRAILVAISAILLICCGGGGGGGGGGGDNTDNEGREDNQNPPQAGVLGGPCFPDGTCDGVLICTGGTCVAPPDSGDGESPTDGGDDGESPTDGGGGGIGSACGSCDQGLTCVTEAPDGYCSKTCSSSEDCGPGAHCYNTDFGQVCLVACQNNDDCRQGYTCQGDVGATVCYPGSGGDTSTGDYSNASFYGCYALNNEIMFRLLFDGVNRFADIQWTYLSGEIRYAGTYEVSGNQITFYYSDGDIKQYSFTMMNNGFNMDGYYYYLYDQGCD